MALRLILVALVLLISQPSVLADDRTVPQGASHVISVHADAVAAGGAAVVGDTLWYSYERPAIPQIPCAGAVVYSFYLLDLATGAKHSPVVSTSGSAIGFRSDGPTNSALAKALGDEPLVDVEFRVEVKCTQPDSPAVSVLIATIGVTP